MPRDRDRGKNRYRDRRSSSYSSESSYERKKSKSKHKRRSRSRDRSESSSYNRRRRSTSRSSRVKIKRRSYSKSLSREKDRYESKPRRRSKSRSRTKRERSRSISSSRNKSKYHKKKSKKSRSSNSRSSSSEIEHSFIPSSKKGNLDDTEIKVEKAIKAAEAVGLTMTKIPTYEYKEVDIKEDMPTIHDRNLLAELNSDSFVPKSFTSSRNKKQSQNIVIDLNSETVKVPETDIKIYNDDSIINFDEILPEEELKEMWILKLYHYRKKMMRGDL